MHYECGTNVRFREDGNQETNITDGCRLRVTTELLQQAQADAIRYRFIREHFAVENGMGWCLHSPYIGGTKPPERPFDAALDVHMLAAKGG